MNDKDKHICAEFAIELRDKIDLLLRKDCGLTFTRKSVIHDFILKEISECSYASHNDNRNRYPHNISIIKSISITASWIAKLKPIDPSRFRLDGKPVAIRRINEIIALQWAITNIFDNVENGNLSELISNSPKNLDLLVKTIDYYTCECMYKMEDGGPKPGTEKFNETTHNFRYKKFTAVNIYENFMHILLPFKIIEANIND